MYRNDHDAALARIDALEGEVRRLQGELDRREAPAEPPEPEEPVVIERPRATSALKVLAYCIFMAIYLLAMPFRHHHHYYSPRPVPRVHYSPPATPTYDRDYRAMQRAIDQLRAKDIHVSQ